MKNKYSALYGYLIWLLLISYSKHISYNALLVLFSPLALIPSRYLFSIDGVLKLPIGILIVVFGLLGAALVGISLLAWRSRKQSVQSSFWILTASFGLILVLVDQVANRQLESRATSLIAGWNLGFPIWVTLLLLGLCLTGLTLLSWDLFQKHQISRTGFIIYLSSCLIVAALFWSMRMPRFEYRDDFSEGLAKVRIYGRWAYVDTSLRVVIPPQFSFARPFSDGLAVVNVLSSRGDALGIYIDKTGKIVLENLPGEARGAFREGLAPIRIDSKYGFMNKAGRIVIHPQFDEVGGYSEGLARISVGSKYGFIDKTGMAVIPPQFDDARSFNEGLAAVRLTDKWGFVGRDGQLVISPQFKHASDFREGLAAVALAGKSGVPSYEKFGYVDKAGRLVIRPEFEQAEDFSGQVAKVMLSGRWISIDRNGRPIN